jgi:Glycosyl transferase family 2
MITIVTTIALNCDLLPYFLKYYSNQQVDNFLILVNAKNESDPIIEKISKELDVYNLKIAKLWYGGFYDTDKTNYENEIIDKYCNEDDWVIYADLDEFQEYNIKDTVKSLEFHDMYAIQGFLFDRMSLDGSLIDIQSTLEETYPLGGNITGFFGAEINKVVMCKAKYKLDIGHHFFKDKKLHQTTMLDKIIVHHFKWRGCMISRMSALLSDQDRNNSNWYNEMRKIIDFFNMHNKFDVQILNLKLMSRTLFI